MTHRQVGMHRQALNYCSEKQPGNHLNAKQVAGNAGLITLISTDHLRKGRAFHCRIDLIYSSNGWAIKKGRKLKTKLLLFCFLVLQTTAEKVFALDNSHSLHWPKPCRSLWEHFHWPQQALGHPSPSLEVTHLQCAMYSPSSRGTCCTSILLLNRLCAPFSTRRVWEDWNMYYLLSLGASFGSLMGCVWSTGNAAPSPKPGMGSWGHLTEMLRNKQEEDAGTAVLPQSMEEQKMGCSGQTGSFRYPHYPTWRRTRDARCQSVMGDGELAACRIIPQSKITFSIISGTL